MFRLLIIPVVMVLSTAFASLVKAQPTSQNDLANHATWSGARFDDRKNPRESYSEAKRLYREGVKYALAGLYSQAAEIFQQAVKLDPQFADAHFALGHAYFDLGRWQKAIESFQRAVELNPNDQEAHERLQQARQMLARETGTTDSPASKSVSPSQPASPPASEQVSLNVKPAPTLETADKPSNSTSSASEAEKENAAANELALTKLYRVGPGDVLDVRINDAPSPQSTLFTVTPAGLLEHPLLAEPLQVGGMSVDEISASIESDLKKRALMDNPKVTVGVRDYASHTILVSGLVKDSGTKVLRREAIPLYVVVADAQPLPEAARVTVVRSEANKTFEIDLSQSADMNLLVRPGDVITLQANATQFLYVGGEVKSPGEKTYRRGLTLTQAILAAGGVTQKGNEARLGRDEGNGFLTVTRYKLKDIEKGKIPDPVVRPGDRITIVH